MKPEAHITFADFGYPVETLWLTCSKRLLNHLAFQPFDYKRIWRMLLQTRVWDTNIDIYVFIGLECLIVKLENISRWTPSSYIFPITIMKRRFKQWNYLLVLLPTRETHIVKASFTRSIYWDIRVKGGYILYVCPNYSIMVIRQWAICYCIQLYIFWGYDL